MGGVVAVWACGSIGVWEYGCGRFCVDGSLAAGSAIERHRHYDRRLGALADDDLAARSLARFFGWDVAHADRLAERRRGGAAGDEADCFVFLRVAATAGDR